MKKALFLLSLVLVIFTSCGSSEETNILTIQQETIARSMPDGATSFKTAGLICTYRLDLSKGVMDLTMAKDMASPAIVFKNISFKTTKDGYTFSAASVIPELNGKPSPARSITDLSGVIYGNDIRFSCKNEDNVTYCSVRNPLYSFSKMTVVEVNNPTPYINTTAKYGVKLNVEDMTADIYIFGAKFADKMPSMDMKIPNVPVIATKDGYTIDIASVIPYIGETPYPKYEMTKLSAKMIDSQFSLNFEFAGKYNATINATINEPKINQ